MGKVFSHDGTAIAYERTGRGPALVLVGGAFQRRGDFGELPTLLAEHFDVITYDRRGRGDSGDTAPHDVQREVEDLDALIDLAGGTAFVHGMSSGAVLALRAAVRGSSISRLSVYEPPFVVDDSRPPIPDDYLEHLTGLVGDDARGDAVAYFLTQAVGVPAEAVAGMRHAPFWADMEAVAHTLPYDGAVMGDTMSGRPLPAEGWNTLADRLLVLDGGASDGWIRAGAHALPGQHGTLDGQDHDVDPSVLAPALIEFFTAEETA
ncbi:alpha/beta fold hydrolase [Streptomyces aquilus]|uniref:Alpha/beta hydrolase n=1 Tax=Streptomyces aquilus TaxID=2548456 RepID=A0A3S9HRZ1_9ACTN|nr:alpha/beta hydrolase [Streptomyces aquilus]AZP14829.1 alpha/beta hydrolase [Streptomyces aquilus]